MTHRIAVCSWSLKPDDPAHLVEHLQNAGIDAVQIALSPLVRDPRIWAETIGELRQAGITIVSGMMAMADEDYSSLESIARTGGVRPDETWPENLQHARAVAGLAATADIRLVTFHAGFLPEELAHPERETLLDRLREIADLFAERNIELGLETGQETAATLLEWLGAIDRPNLGVNFDPANMILYGKGDPIDALNRLQAHVMQIHIKDALPASSPGEWGTEVPAGEGAVDWPRFFEIALRIEPPVDFVIEREQGGSRKDDVKAARHLVAEAIEKHASVGSS